MQQEKLSLWLGGNIITLDERQPGAEALAVADGRICCVGSVDEVRGFAAGRECTEHDLAGACVVPGFIDTHSHLSSFSSYCVLANCGSSRGSIPAVLDALKAWAAENPDGWIMGYAYDDTGLPEQRHLTRDELDGVSRDRPVFVSHISIHFGYANTKALELLGYDTPHEIAGGEICVDANGRPNGVLAENAFFNALGKLPQPTPAQMRDNLRKAMSIYASRGFTTFMDGGVGVSGGSREFMAAYMDLERAGQMDVRGYLQLLEPEMEAALVLGMHDFGSPTLRIGGAKAFSDGSIQGYTGALTQGYHDRPEHRSGLVQTQEQLDAFVQRYHAQGVQVALHANGDAGVEAVVSAFEKAHAKNPRKDLAHMVVHAQMASDAHLQRMQAIGVIPTFFARHIEVWGDRHVARFIGPDRAARLDPCASAVRLGMPFGLHVDSPVLEPTALGSMHAAVNRVSSGGALIGPDQRISQLDALKAYTTHASLCCRDAAGRGSLAPGKHADFVVLGANPLSCPAGELRDVTILATVCGGRKTYG